MAGHFAVVELSHATETNKISSLADPPVDSNVPVGSQPPRVSFPEPGSWQGRARSHHTGPSRAVEHQSVQMLALRVHSLRAELLLQNVLPGLLWLNFPQWM